MVDVFGGYSHIQRVFQNGGTDTTTSNFSLKRNTSKKYRNSIKKRKAEKKTFSIFKEKHEIN